MAINLTDEDGKELALFPALPNGTNIDSFPVLSAGSLYLSTVAQLKAQIAGPGGGLNPTVTLVVPATGLVGVPVSFVATPVANGGATVAKVEFFVGANKAGQATQAPWIYDYTPAVATQAGERPSVVTAKVTDSNMAQGTSQNYGLTVSMGATAINKPPVVTMRLTPRNAVVGQTVAIEAMATDPDGTIARIELYDYGQLVDAATSSPYTFQFPATANNVGQHYFSLKAYDNLNAPTQTPGQAVTVAEADETAPIGNNTVPGAPTNATGTAGNNTVSVNATPPASNGGAAITAYKIYRNGSQTALATASTLPYADTTAVNGTAYTYQLSAVNSVGEGPKSAASAAVTPAAPTFTPTLTGPSDTESSGVTLTTDGNSDQVQYAVLSSVADTTPKTMYFSASGTIVTSLDYPASYEGQGITYKRASSGAVSTFTFTDGATNAL